MKRPVALAALLVALPLAAAAQGTPATPCECGSDDPKAWIAACQADIAAAAPDDTTRLSADYADLTFADINLALQGDHRFDAAIADATKGIALDPDDATAYLNRANAYFYAGSYDKSLADLVEVMRLDPKEGKAHNLRCTIYVKQDRAKEAVNECELAIALGFDRGWSQLSLADALVASGDKAGAIEHYQRALASGDLFGDEESRAAAALKALGP
jgi:tetratricopeptide (TPR) repeat protein